MLSSPPCPQDNPTLLLWGEADGLQALPLSGLASYGTRKAIRPLVLVHLCSGPISSHVSRRGTIWRPGERSFCRVGDGDAKQRTIVGIVPIQDTPQHASSTPAPIWNSSCI